MTEDENFRQINGVVTKAFAGDVRLLLWGLVPSSGGSTLTQQLIKQQVVAMFQPLVVASEIIDALALTT